MIKDKIDKRIEGRYEVIKECLETIYQQLSEIHASLESIKMLSYFKDDLKEDNQ